MVWHPDPSARFYIYRERSLPPGNPQRHWLDLQWEARDRAQDATNSVRGWAYRQKRRMAERYAGLT